MLIVCLWIHHWKHREGETAGWELRKLWMNGALECLRAERKQRQVYPPGCRASPANAGESRLRILSLSQYTPLVAVCFSRSHCIQQRSMAFNSARFCVCARPLLIQRSAFLLPAFLIEEFPVKRVNHSKTTAAFYLTCQSKAAVTVSICTRTLASWEFTQTFLARETLLSSSSMSASPSAGLRHIRRI